jgi:membrane protease YdiL (CAAX protease family)
MKWLYCSIALAALGLVLSIASHIAALQGKPGTLGRYTWTLHLGALAICIPAAIVARKAKWKALLSGCPAWMRYALYAFIAYAIVNFGIFVATPRTGGAGLMPPPVVRGFSGHWMAIYAAAFAVLYSGLKAKRSAT